MLTVICGWQKASAKPVWCMELHDCSLSPEPSPYSARKSEQTNLSSFQPNFNLTRRSKSCYHWNCHTFLKTSSSISRSTFPKWHSVWTITVTTNTSCMNEFEALLPPPSSSLEILLAEIHFVTCCQRLVFPPRPSPPAPPPDCMKHFGDPRKSWFFFFFWTLKRALNGRLRNIAGVLAAAAYSQTWTFGSL